MKKIVKINGKTFIYDEVTKQLEEVTPEDGAEVIETEDEKENEVEEAVDEAAEKLMSKLGVDKILEDLKSLKETITSNTEDKKVSALIDLEKLMNKSVDKMTSKEKIVGFFQGLIQSNHAVLKALSEGTAADGG